jgi:hypothetical protein
MTPERARSASSEPSPDRSHRVYPEEARAESQSYRQSNPEWDVVDIRPRRPFTQSDDGSEQPNHQDRKSERTGGVAHLYAYRPASRLL